MQFDIPVTAGPCWCLESNRSKTRLAVSMSHMKISMSLDIFIDELLSWSCGGSISRSSRHCVTVLQKETFLGKWRQSSK